MSEHQEQAGLFRWAAMISSRHPELALMFAVPNGGHRHIAVAAKLRVEGVKSGVPDIFLPVARGGYHGMAIEMKTAKGKLSPAQKQWLENLSAQGYHAVMCRGWENASAAIEFYLAGARE